MARFPRSHAPRSTLHVPCRRAAVGALLLCGLLAAHLAAGRAAAHPLGNFTINHYSRLDFADGAVALTYVLDFAEIPTFQQLKQLDTDGDGALAPAEADAYLDAALPGYLRGLQLVVGGRALPLAVVDRAATFVPGQGGLPTLRVAAHLRADLPPDWRAAGAANYADRNFPDRIGWREIVVRGGPGVAVAGSCAPAEDLSNELRAYPQDRLASPLDRSAATFTLAPGGAAPGVAPAPVPLPAGANAAALDQVTRLLGGQRLTPLTLALALLVALGWGAAHALTPGHGKTVVAAYLVGARGTSRHAVFLGLTVTLTHTAGVFALGAVTLYLSHYLLPERLYPWLSAISGALVVAIGLVLLRQRLRGLWGRSGARAGHTPGDHDHVHGEHDHGHSHAHEHSGHTHDHAHPHTHDHGELAQPHIHSHTHDGHTHSHLPPGADGGRVTWRGLLALGVSGGLLPCPSALVLLLSAISFGRVGLGLALVLAFSTGLAGVLTGIGLLLVRARWLFDRFSFESRLPRLLPAASALVIALAGAAIVLEALRQLGTV
ncbi:MAG TPA: hypothetical protein VFW96_00055 [Thermomicrobiales bacterium]|nr:hypothetical protein [Thermomicrobiales bacterium]